MKNRKTVICRLCCKTIEDCTEEFIDEIKMEMFKVLLLDLNLDTIEKSMMCTECVKQLEDAFNFKSTCLYTEDYITPFLENNDVIELKELYRKKVDDKCVLDETTSVCRLCMGIYNDNECIKMKYIEQDVYLQVMLKTCVPEMNLNATVDTSICKQCLDGLQKMYNFSMDSLKAEKKLQTYFSLEDVNEKIKVEPENSSELLVDRSYKEEQCTVSEYTNLEVASTTTVKVEEDEIEFEDGFGSLSEVGFSQQDALEESHVCWICGFATKVEQILNDHSRLHKGESKKYACHLCTYEVGNTFELRRHFLSHQTAADATYYQCYHCPFKTKYTKSLAMHIQRHEEGGEVFKCDQCDFQNTHRQDMNRHKLSHTRVESTSEFRCAHCPFVTLKKPNLSRHLLGHKDKTRVLVFKCPDCPFTTKDRRYLPKHMLKHMKLEDSQLLKCDQCDFRTKYPNSMHSHKQRHQEASLECFHCQAKFKTKSGLIKHLATHRPRSERKLYECHLCDYKTIQSQCLRKHMVYHKRPEEIETFKCTVCAFVTIRKAKLKVHMKTHMSKEELTMYKCPECEYETKWRYNLKKHALIHDSMYKATMFKCPTCNYQTKYEQALKTHVLNHEGALPIFTCAECDYTTKVKNNLVQHVNRKHKSPKEARVFKCDECEFVCRDKGNLKNHKLTHRDDVDMYSCHECHFETKYKQVLYTHVKFHRSKKTYTCDFCGVQTRHGSNFRRHVELCMENRGRVVKEESDLKQELVTV